MDERHNNRRPVRPGYVDIRESDIPQEKKLAMKPLVLIGSLFAAAVIVVGILLYRRAFGASTTVLSMQDYFATGENEASILYNDTISSHRGVLVQDTFYLPLSFVKEVDDFYYYDEVAQLLLYARPLELMRYEVASVGSLQEVGANTSAFRYNNEVYIQDAVLEDNTLVVLEKFRDPGRIWVWDRVNEKIPALTAVKSTKVRQSNAKRSDIVKELEAGAGVYLLQENKNWHRVMTMDGVIGYVPAADTAQSTPVVHSTTKKAWEYTSNLLAEPVCMVWHQLFASTVDTQVTRFENAIDLTRGVNVISPTWFSLISADGTITSVGDPAYTEAAHARGLQVWALIDNFNKAVDNLALLRGYPYRAKLISMLMEEAKRLNIDGINIDFEGNSTGLGGLNRDCGVHFIQFLRELSIECRKAGLVLSVDNYVPMDYNQYYHRDQQAQVVDYVIVMGYDEHYGGSDPGSTASLPFVKNGIEKTLAQVPKEKVINAVPFYTRLWKMTPADQAGENAKIINDAASPIGPYALSSSAYGIKAMGSLLEGKNAQLRWLETEQQYYTEYESEGCYYRLWLEDVKSMTQRAQIMASYDIAGVACWKLGMETPEIWDVLYDALH